MRPSLRASGKETRTFFVSLGTHRPHVAYETLLRCHRMCHNGAQSPCRDFPLFRQGPFL